MSRAKTLVKFCSGLAVILFFTASCFAQYGSSIEGTVLDQSGAAVPTAKVTAINEATGVARESTTNESGFYRISGLAPGSYTVSAEAGTFKKQTSSGVVVTAEAVQGLNISLQPGGSQETVNVVSGVEELQTENASVTGTITEQQVTDLPSFGRDAYELVRLTPGVFADSARQANGNSQAIPQQVGPGGSNSQIFQTENQVQAIADGQRVSANDYVLDGVSVNSLEWGGAAVVTPNPESVEQISVASNTYSAQDGRNSGAQVKVISKSGTNNFHGSAFIKFNDKGLNAFNKFEGPTNLPKSQLTCEAGTPSQFS
ncbi:MAG TPA: carboxypeptidase regulatory-like domain-containing protein, partial [Terriglobales bacterium]